VFNHLLDSVIEIDAEYEFQAGDELTLLENWVHINPEVLKSGTVKHVAPPGLNEEEAADYVDKLTSRDPVTERLKSISEDTRKQ
jgi:hypothetical protein